MQYVSQAFCPIIGAWLMNLDGQGGTPEIAMTASLIAAVLTIAVTAIAFPETLDKCKTSKGGCTAAVDTDQEACKQHSVQEAVRLAMAKRWANMKAGVTGIGIGNICFLGLAILCTTIGIKANDWYGLVQYPVIRLSWTFPEASSVVSIQALIMLLNFAILLPTYSQIGAKYLGTVAKANFTIMISSSVLLTIGSVFIGFSTTALTFILGMIVYTLGAGLPVATQAFVASLMDKSKLARVMAILSIAATGGKVVASGLFPQVLALGLDSGIKMLVGLPFFVAAALFLCAGLCVMIVGLRTGNSNGYESIPSEEE
jgi:hypothetical protein